MAYAITGVHTGISGGAFPLRQEIDTWSADAKNVDQVNLYLQALASFQQIPHADKLSYFQIAGIHGEPFIPWDENTRPNAQTRWRGYCTHASVLFPTWHRPYLAVFEQILHQIMLQIVQAYPDQSLRTRYQTAAETFRIPYWDSAQLKDRAGRRSLNVPYLCTLPVVEVFTPTGMMTIDNPLYSFKFNGPPNGVTSFRDQQGNFYPFATALGTSRYPPRYNERNPTVTQQWSAGFVNNDAITRALQNLSSFGEDVYRSFTTNNYVWFASTQQTNPPAPDSYQSLESIHNEIHGLTGGGGHMSWNTVSSFDPIFWLHHANVDRLFAIWQALYPNSWFDSPSQQLRDERGTWSIPAGARETPDTPLTPFHSDERGTAFSSDDIRDWTRFGSSYPELQPWLPQYQDPRGQFNPTLYRNDVVQKVTQLYSRVRGRVQRTAVPRTRLFAENQSGVPSFAGAGSTTTAGSTGQAFAPPAAFQSQSFAAPPTQGQQQTTSPAVAQQQFAPPPTQQFGPPATQTQQFAPPPTQEQQQFTSPPVQGQQQFAAPPTQGQQQFAAPPTQGQQQFVPPAQQQFAPQVQQQFPSQQSGQQGAPQAAAPAPKKSGLGGLMSSARKHFDEAVVAGRTAAQGSQSGQQGQVQPGQTQQGQFQQGQFQQGQFQQGQFQPGQTQPGQFQPNAPQTQASSGSAFAAKFGSMVGGGIHLAQERLSGHKKTPSTSGQRGLDGPDDQPGTEGELSRGLGDMNISQTSSNEPVTYHEYDCNVRFERFDLGGRPFTVHIFLGDFNPDPSTWMWDNNRVGGVYNFVAGVQRGDDNTCSHCEEQSEEHTIVTGQISLTNAIMDDVEDSANGLSSLLPEEVIPYLQRHLHWRITDPNGVEIPRDELRTLKISVIECSATIPTNPGEFTHYGPPRVLDIVTTGRPGGKTASDGY